MKQFDTVEKALDELKQGHLILVTDDEDRENEGDLICAASFCHDRKCQFHGDACEGLNLYADERRNLPEAAIPTDGDG